METTRYPSILDIEALEYIRVHLKETPEQRQDSLKQIRKYFDQPIDTKGTTIKITTEDDILVAYLRSCKYNLPQVITKLENFYRMRAEMPSVFSNRDAHCVRVQKALRLGCFVPMRKLNHGRLVIIVRVGAFNPSEFTLEEILKMAYMVLDVCNKICPYLQVYGACQVFDLSGMSLAHAKCATPSILKHMVHSWENYLCTPKQLEFINVPTFVNALLRLIRSFMKKEMKAFLRVHSDWVMTLAKVVDKSVLPVEYGGEDGSIEEHVEYWVQEITRNAQWFLFDEGFQLLKN